MGRAGQHFTVELRALVRLAAPVAAVQFGLMLMGAVDTIMCGHHSSAALAAVSLGNVYHWGLLVLGQGVLLSLDPLIAQSFGAGDRAAISRWFQRGLVLAAVLTVPFFLAFRHAAPVLALLRQPPETVPLAAAWIRAVAWSVPPFFAFGAMRQTLQAIHVVRPVVIAVVIANMANVLGNWVLVFGHLGAPALGAVGSGYATTVSRWLMAGILGLGTAPALAEVWQPPTRALFDLRSFGRMLSLGIPIGLQIGLEVWVFLTVSVMMGWMGQRVLAAHQIAINLASLSFMVPLGIGAAAAVRVGNAVGRRDPAGMRRAALTALVAGALVMTVSATAFAALPRLLARLYSSDESVVSLAASLLPIAALFQIFDGTQAVGSGILRGVADTRAAAVINLVGYWVLGLPVGLLLAFRLGWGPRGLWWGLTVGLMIVAVLLVARVLRRMRTGRA